MKRMLDFFFGIFFLVLFSPIIVVTALGVRFRLGKPVFYKQERPGLYGKPFYFYKFRTMIDAYDSDGNLLPDEQRMTPFGRLLRKYSIDELPQLLNVIKGDMSFVGPRPLLMEYLPLYSPEQERRHEVRPGITGWAQVNGRNDISWEEKFKLDLWYVENKSLWLDLKILILTFIKVLRCEGINQKGHATMPEFRGNKENFK
ncbi:MAG: sugar transferase [Desulfitobacteriaceae bacterium]|nr:sugar transferase [Desulfitobacteriaceae bacterium]MDD4751914.1 sugar transferase [Desulfitobacteriaceae bacterium]